MAKTYTDKWQDVDKGYSRGKKRRITAAVSAKILPKLWFGCKKKKDDGVLFSAALTADWHVDGDTYRGRNNMIREGLVGINCYKKFDAIFIAGDITNSGHEIEYVNLEHYLEKYNRVERVVPEMGNHDTRATSVDNYYNEGLEAYNGFCKYCGIEKDEKKPYFALDLNGYRVISMASEGIPNNDQAEISDEQLEWLETELKNAAQNKKPVFLLNHQPPTGINGAFEGGSVGESSEKIGKILGENSSSDVPVIYISGHMHVMRECGFENPKEGLYYLNLTTFLYCRGIGFSMDVYADRIILEGCNFVTGEKLDGYRYEINLKK